MFCFWFWEKNSRILFERRRKMMSVSSLLQLLLLSHCLCHICSFRQHRFCHSKVLSSSIRRRGLRISEAHDGSDYDVVVVGAGVGGLASAARLAHEGLQVLVVEANDEDVATGSGGRCGTMWLTSVNGDKYRFDTGPSLLLLPDVYEEAFALAGGEQDFKDSLGPLIQRVNGPIYTIYFDDGKSSASTPTPLVLWGGEEGFAADCQAMDALEPDGGQRYAKHMVQTQRILDGGLPNFIEMRPRVPALLQMLGECLLGGAFPLEPQERQLRRRFRSPRARAALSFQSLYVGLTPFAAPGVFSLLQPLELGPVPDARRAEREPRRQGVFYPVGAGFGGVSAAFLDLARSRGARVEFGRRVTALEFHGGSTPSTERDDGGGGGAEASPGKDSPAVVSGVRCLTRETGAERVVTARRVLVNADLPLAEERLVRCTASDETARSSVPPATASRDFSKAAFSSSVVAFHFALDVRLHGLSHHSLFLATDALSDDEGGGGGGGGEEEEPRRVRAWDWEGLMSSPRQGPEDGDAVNFYVHCPARTDPTVCPPDHDAVTVLVPCPTTPTIGGASGGSPTTTATTIDDDDDDDDDDAALVARCRALVLGRFDEALATPHGFRFEDHIVAEDVVSPKEWRRKYGLGKGAVFGLAHPLWQLSLFRPGPRHPQVQGLYFCGASSRPGNGVPLVLIGARQTTDVLLRDIAEDS